MPDYQITFRLVKWVWSDWVKMEASCVVNGKTYKVSDEGSYTQFVNNLNGARPDFAKDWCEDTPRLLADLIATDMRPQLPPVIDLNTVPELDYS